MTVKFIKFLHQDLGISVDILLVHYSENLSNILLISTPQISHFTYNLFYKHPIYVFDISLFEKKLYLVTPRFRRR